MTGIIDRLRAMQGMGDIQLKALMDGVGPQAADEIERLRSESSRLHKEADKFGDGIDWIQRALQAEAQIEAMEQQVPVAWAATDETCRIVEALSFNQSRRFDTPLYALPGAQSAPSVPREAIAKMLTQLMDIAVANGADSRSMPDEYVEVAAWLCGIPAQPTPRVPEAKP